MSKDTIIAIAPAEVGNKKEQGKILGLRVDNGQVMAMFIGQSSRAKTRDVKFKDLGFPHNKARNAAEALRADVIAEFVPED
ncbi:MAG: hypothetical protein WCT50_03880 [Patescibacteria group bacterium]